MKMDDKTEVPLTWIFAMIVPTVMGTLAFANINSRLARIEDRLGLVPYGAFNLVPDAHAHEKAGKRK